MKLNREFWKIALKVTHYITVVALLGMIGLFLYEKKLTDFNDFATVVSIVPTKNEFEGNEPIQFFLFVESDKEITVDVDQYLMCDFSSGSGFEFVSSQRSQLFVRPRDYNDEVFSIIRTVLDNTGRRLTTTQVTDQLRSLVRVSDVSDSLVYGGDTPTDTSDCFMNFEFSTSTANFNIVKYAEEDSFQFDYVWYYSGIEDSETARFK